MSDDPSAPSDDGDGLAAKAADRSASALRWPPDLWIQQHPTAPVDEVETLSVDTLPAGVHRLRLRITEDAIGRGVSIPVAIVRGAKPGPTVGLVAAIHGNELNGIAAIHSVLDVIVPAQLNGSLVAAMVANVPGFLSHDRLFSDVRDLNRRFPGAGDGNESEVYAHRVLERLITAMDTLLDLHTASFGRVNSHYLRADMSDAEVIALARKLHAQIILHDPPKETTLRGAASACGVRAVTVEIGDPQIFDDGMIDRARGGILDALAHLGCGAFGSAASSSAKVPPAAIECTSSEWLYTDTGGLLRVHPPVGATVSAGEVIAELTDPFGRPVRTYRAPEAGVVIGKSTNPVAGTGARILHLGCVGSVTPFG